ncbi:m7GpppX diphosphatase [Planococcus citri]|uniref:m7GpppX diphosphatase n=1 Tax=Planococcus citri TaxID=170843 RepID=UPI0031F9CA26
MESEIEFQDLSKFIVKRVLSDSSQRKTICVEGEFQDKDGKFILLLEKKAFTEDNVKNLCIEKSILKKEFINDVYGSYELFPSTELNGVKATVIYPASEHHIKKFERTRVHILEETEEIYNNITLPYILQHQLSLEWVFNILEHKSEKDRIVYEDTDPENGFILIPDLKWDGKQFETLYLLAICNKRGLKSLRDLNSSHIQLLNNILYSGSKAIEDKYGLTRSRLRIFFHYPPSFYHLHVHFTYIDFEAPGINFERAHSLVSVLENIRTKGDYYQRTTLLFPIRESENLFVKYKEEGLLSPVNNCKRVKNDEPSNENVD